MAIAPPPNKTYQKKPTQGKCYKRRPWAIATLGIIAIVGIVALFKVESSDEDKALSKEIVKDRRVKEVKPDVPVHRAQTQRQEAVDAKPKPEILGKTPTGLEYVKHIAQTNKDGVVVSRYQLPDGSWTRVVQLQSKDSLIFETALDNQLALIAMTPVNQMLPPMPPIGNLEEAFKEAIAHPIIITENDSEKARELKEAVKDIRLQITDLLHEGYTVNQILADDASLRVKNVEFRRELQQELNEIYRNEGPKAAEEYMDVANERLEEHGIIPLSMPESGNSKKRRN